MKEPEFTFEFYNDKDMQEVRCKITCNHKLNATDIEGLICGTSYTVPKEGTAEYAVYVAIEAMAGDRNLRLLLDVFDVDGRIII